MNDGVDVQTSSTMQKLTDLLLLDQMFPFISSILSQMKITTQLKRSKSSDNDERDFASESARVITVSLICEIVNELMDSQFQVNLQSWGLKEMKERWCIGGWV